MKVYYDIKKNKIIYFQKNFNVCHNCTKVLIFLVFYSSLTTRRARVWRMTNERFAPVCVAEHDRFGGGSVMVWAGISAHGKTDLHVIDNGTLTALRYVNEILDVYVRPYAGAVSENFILMDDNARAHRARITDQYLEQATIVITCFITPRATSICAGAQTGSS